MKLVICISGLCFSAVGRHLEPPKNLVREIDATGRFVMPGGIDPHTHLELRFMGQVSVDDFYIGSRAALAGGTTMVSRESFVVVVFLCRVLAVRVSQAHIFKVFVFSIP